MLAGFSALLLLPALAWVAPPSLTTWKHLLASCCAHGLYQLGLINALQHNDLSRVFPIMRGTAPLLVAGGAWLVLGENLSLEALVGLLLATLGVIAFALPENRRISTAIAPSALAWSLLTAVGITAYSVTDTIGVRAETQPLTFILWLFVLEGVWLNTLAFALRGNGLFERYATLWRYGLLGAVGAVLSYGAMLFAFALMETARASALRETSIVFAALFGSWFLSEPFGRRRALLAGLVAAGLILLQLF